MGIRIVAREARLQSTIHGLLVARSRSKQLPLTLLERQRGDHRSTRYNSNEAAAIISTAKIISEGGSLRSAARAAGFSGYYGGSGGGGGGGGGWGGGGGEIP